MKHRKLKIKFGGVFWGLLLIAAAVLLVLDELGFSFGATISIWQIVIGALLCAWFVTGLIHRHFFRIFFSLAFLVLVFEAPISYAIGRGDGNLISNWILLLAAFLLSTGFHILFLEKKFHMKAHVTEKHPDRVENAMGNTTVYIDAKALGTYRIENAVGQVEAYIENADQYAGEGTIHVENAAGRTLLHIPSHWRVILTEECAIGTIQNRMPSNPDGTVLYLHAECAAGCVEISPL